MTTKKINSKPLRKKELNQTTTSDLVSYAADCARDAETALQTALSALKTLGMTLDYDGLIASLGPLQYLVEDLNSVTDNVDVYESNAPNTRLSIAAAKKAEAEELACDLAMQAMLKDGVNPEMVTACARAHFVKAN
jgi:hypothetical protein